MKKLALVLALLLLAGTVAGCTSDGTNPAVYTHPSAGQRGFR